MNDHYADSGTNSCIQCSAGDFRNNSDNGCEIPVYVWVTGCTVQGDMTGGCDSSLSGVSTPPASGVDRANVICEENRPAGASGTTNQALLAIYDSDPNNDYDPRTDFLGRRNVVVRRPDGTRIAINWSRLFTARTAFSVPLRLDNGVTGTSAIYWTGLIDTGGSPDVLEPSTSTCNNWADGTSGIEGEVGVGNDTDPTAAFAHDDLACNNDRRILCVTY